MKYCTALAVLLVFLALGSASFAADMPPLIGIIPGDTTHLTYATYLIAAGDHDGDGYTELLIDNGRLSYYLYKGGRQFNEEVYFRFTCVNPHGAVVDDLNGDGQSDLVLSGCPQIGKKANVYFGGNLLDTLRDLWFGQDSAPASRNPAVAQNLIGGASNELVFASADGRAVVIHELAQNFDSLPDIIVRPYFFAPNEAGSFGLYGTVIADFNGDGTDDLAISHCPSNLSQKNGRIHFYWGGPGFDTVPDFTIVRQGTWSTSYNLFGSVLTCPGDLNGDGYPDIFVASDGLDDTAWVYYGGPTIDDIPDVIIPTYLQNAGPAGDINRDGYDDLIASTFAQFSGYGAVYIWYGGPDFDSIPDVRIFNSDNQDYETYFGQSAIGIGDFNGDGVDDFAFSCYDLDTRGKIYVYSGTGIPDDTPIEYEPSTPNSPHLYQNYPNPFNVSTVLKFEISERSRVSLLVTNVRGEVVERLIDSDLSRGTYKVEWDGCSSGGGPLASGVYFCTLVVGDRSITRKALLLK